MAVDLVELLDSRKEKLERKGDTKAASALTIKKLWADIIARTDEIYIVCEYLRGAFEEVMRLMIQGLELDPDANVFTKGKGTDSEEDVRMLVFGPLKNPVRTHQKALDDYADRHSDGELPEACVTDMIRARAVCPDAKSMMALLRLLVSGYKIQLANKNMATLKLVRLKNKCHAPDPTHFRNILSNLTLETGGKTCFVELQVPRTVARSTRDHVSSPTLSNPRPCKPFAMWVHRAASRRPVPCLANCPAGAPRPHP